MGRKLKMRFHIKETGRLQWFDGQITTYDGLTGKYGVYFPYDRTTVFIDPNDGDVEFIEK